MTREELVSEMKNGVSVFHFIKKDGTTRRAVGTLNPKIIAGFEDSVKHRELKTKVASAIRNCRDGLHSAEVGLQSLEEPTIVSKERKLYPNTQNYYDIEKQLWRMFIIENLVQ